MAANFVRTTCALAVTVLLTACGGSSGQSVAVPPNLAQQTARAGTRLAPGTSSGDLLYVSDVSSGKVYVLSYPTGKLVNTLLGVHFPFGLCVDRSGNVYVADQGGHQVLEYAHGGTEPIATWEDTQYPDACSVDPVTGNLAVANESGNVSVYPSGKKQPTIYTTPFVPWFAAYDDAGNLFASGSGAKISVGELPRNGDAFERVSYDGTNNGTPAGLQWVGKHLTFGSASRYSGNCCGRIWRYVMKGLRGTRAGSRHIPSQMLNFFIDGSTAIVTAETGRIALFDYPKGGKAPKYIKAPNNGAYGVVISPGTAP